MGRDVIGYHVKVGGTWDNYQCKHYKDPLTPSNIWPELAKLIYFAKRGDLTLPSDYYFVAPLGGGPTLTRLLEKPDELQKELEDNWPNAAIIKGSDIPLTSELKDFISKIDFGMFHVADPLWVLEGHRGTTYHALRFGGGLTKPRPKPELPPDTIQQSEARYVSQLYSAYSEHLNRTIGPGEIDSDAGIGKHFKRCRENFYRAESLRQFGRDSSADGCNFELLQEEIFVGIIDTVEANHADGYTRARETTTIAAGLALSGHVLADYLTVHDRHGVCHQLCNGGRISWVVEDE